MLRKPGDSNSIPGSYVKSVVITKNKYSSNKHKISEEIEQNRKQNQCTIHGKVIASSVYIATNYNMKIFCQKKDQGRKEGREGGTEGRGGGWNPNSHVQTNYRKAVIPQLSKT